MTRIGFAHPEIFVAHYMEILEPDAMSSAAAVLAVSVGLSVGSVLAVVLTSLCLG